MSYHAEPKKFSTHEFRHLLGSGFGARGQTLELLDGDIYSQGTASALHAGCLRKLTRRFLDTLGEDCILSVRSPLAVDEMTFVTPDLAVLLPRSDFYTFNHPTPADTAAVIEVADGSPGFDRREKKGVYARSGIGEFWIVNVADRQVEVFTKPHGGDYRKARVARPGEDIVFEAVPGHTFLVFNLLP